MISKTGKELTKISEIIQSGTFNNFIGLKEDLYFEAKGKNPYDLDSPNGRYELAKDVSAFANANGGYIIIGLVTESLETERTDKVVETDLFKKEKFMKDRFVGIIKEYIYPENITKELQCKWKEEKEKQGYGIGYIFIPKQSQNKKYFLIKNIREGNKKIKEIVFGICKRVGSENKPFTIKELHKNIQNGINPIQEKLNWIEKKIDILIERGAPSSELTPLDKLDERISEILKSED